MHSAGTELCQDLEEKKLKMTQGTASFPFKLHTSASSLDCGTLKVKKGAHSKRHSEVVGAEEEAVQVSSRQKFLGLGAGSILWEEITLKAEGPLHPYESVSWRRSAPVAEESCLLCPGAHSLPLRAACVWDECE